MTPEAGGVETNDHITSAEETLERRPGLTESYLGACLTFRVEPATSEVGARAAVHWEQ
jgi:hypothetical protein